MNRFQASAPAKFILFGEHAVVYGQPAIAVPILDLRAFSEIRINHTFKKPFIFVRDFNIEFSLNQKIYPAKIKHIIEAIHLVEQKTGHPFPKSGWQLDIWSDIPIARGLGSSAAISVVLIKILFKLINQESSQLTLIGLSFELEKHHHGRPSGIDNTVIALEKPILFQKNKEVQVINTQKFYFVIGDTGIGKKTGEVIAEVAECYKKNRSQYDNICQLIGEIANCGLIALEAGDQKKLGQLMNQNQHLLEKIGVSCPELNQLIGTARDSGALGAKLCGAGQGGCMVALADNQKTANSIAQALKKAGAERTFVTVLKTEHNQ